MTAMVVNRELIVSVAYSNTRFKDMTIQKFIDRYIDTLKLVLDKCFYKDAKEFTPSDFDAVEISQEDLDALFN